VTYEIKSHVKAIFSHAYQVAAVLRYGRVDLPIAWKEKTSDPLFKTSCGGSRSGRILNMTDCINKDPLINRRGLRR
jgi:hypothetical protein